MKGRPADDEYEEDDEHGGGFVKKTPQFFLRTEDLFLEFGQW